jgi:predicted alpha/beta hydrolase family esterase
VLRSAFVWISCTGFVVLTGTAGCASNSVTGTGSGGIALHIRAGSVFSTLMAVHNRTTLSKPNDGQLIVFIEGDGRAWVTATSAAVDPTPRSTPMLDLMRTSNVDAVYLGRPCYWINTFVAPCAPKYWTSHRFSDEVVTAMTVAVRQLRSDAERPVLLVGHSGGGTLAVLIAARLSGEVGVITFGAVLDHAAWTTRHGVSALSGSLNPAQMTANMRSFSELHVFATRDETVRVADSQSYLNARGGRPYTTIEGDHLCCWAEWWQTQGMTALSKLRDTHENSRGKQ